MSKGRYGIYGGQYIPETLMQAVQEVEAAYEKYSKDEEFQRELEDLLKHYAGRPSLLCRKNDKRPGRSQNLSEKGGFKPYRLPQD